MESAVCPTCRGRVETRDGKFSRHQPLMRVPGTRKFCPMSSKPVPDPTRPRWDGEMESWQGDLAAQVIMEHEPRPMGCKCGAKIGDDIDRRWHLVNQAIAATERHLSGGAEMGR